MQQVILHTEYLLTIHECVIIPGLGGFIGRVSPARFDESKSTWMPPQKELSFNSCLFHNDGLLIDSYINTYSVTYSEAFVMVEKAVLDLKKELSIKKEVQFGRIGTFKYNDNGALLFSPANDLFYFSSATYGLFPIKIPLLDYLKVTQMSDEESITEEEVEKISIDSKQGKSPDTIYIPLRIKKKLLYRISSVAVIILMFLFLSTPIYDDTTNKTNYAKLLAPDMRNTDDSPKESDFFISRTDTSDTESKMIEINESCLPEPEPNINVIDKAPANVENKTSSLNQEISGRYYVVIGSFPSDRSAQQFLDDARQSDSLPNACTIKSKGGKNYKVCADSFGNSSEAYRFLNSFLDRHDEYSDAWVYFSK